VIPNSFQDKIISIAHEGHLGMVKTKKLLRSKVWFPNIGAMVEAKIKTCMACQGTDKSGTHVTPVFMTQMPEHPWERVSSDFYGSIQPITEYLMVAPLVESIFSIAIS
jgi:hypothetical protein